MQPKPFLVVLLCVLTSGLAGSLLYGQPLAAGQPFEATVLSVEGSVEVKLPGEADWQDAQVDMKLPVDTTISTGVKSKVGLDFDGHAVVTIRRPSVVRLDRCLLTQAAAETRLHLKVGSLKAGVATERVASDFRITTPRVSLSVRGTEIADVTHSERGTEVRMGKEGRLDMTKYFRPARLTRSIPPRAYTRSIDLIQIVDARKLEQSYRSYRFGRTEAEQLSAQREPNNLEDSRAEFTREAAHPEIHRLIRQEAPELVVIEGGGTWPGGK